MRIRGTGSIHAPNAPSSTQTQSTGSSFRSLLKQRIDAMREDGAVPTEATMPESLGMIEDAAQILDEAMSRLQTGEAPDPEVVHALRELRKRLRQHMPEGEGALAELDTLIAVETHRLEQW